MSTAIGPLPTAAGRDTRVWNWSWLAFIVAALWPAALAGWVLWLAPIADLAADRTAVAARDFTALWGAGNLAVEHATAILSDPAQFTHQLRDWFGPDMPAQIWPYPPPTLQLASLVAQFPLAWSFLLYTAGTLLLLWYILRVARLPRLMCAVALFSPAVADNALIGQNGAMTAACLAGGLLLVAARPILGGALLGALILKPQMALLVPFCLIADRNWRAGLAALAVASMLIALSWLAFGDQAWVDYLQTARPAVTAYFETPWDAAAAQRIFASAFMAARSLGADLTTAYSIQALLAASCAVIAFSAWRQPHWDKRRRMALTVALTCVASPWVHSYDMPALAVALVTLTPASRSQDRPFLAIAWCWPGALTSIAIPNALLVLSSASIAWLAWRADRHDVKGRSLGRPDCVSSAS